MCGTRGTFFKDKRRGAVLILVLFVLTGLSVLTVEFSRDILLDHAMSTSTRSILAAKPLMESGERLATAVLTRNSEAGTPDHVREDWGLFGLGLERLSAELPGADLSGSIEDENSRFPINAIFYEREADRARAEAFADILTRLLAGLMRVHGYAGGPDNALALAKEYVDSLRQWGGQTETDQDTLKWYLTQNAALPAAGTPLAGARGNPPRALASCRTGMGTGCSARNEGTARPAGNPDHLDAGAHEHEHAPTRRTQRARPRRTAGAALRQRGPALPRQPRQRSGGKLV